MAYTPDQIKQFITDKGIGNNPYAMYNYAQQYGVAPGAIDQAMGYDTGTSDKWIASQGLKGLDGSGYGGTARSTAPVTDQQIQQFVQGRGIADNPQAMQAFAQQYGVNPGQVDSAMGYQSGTAANWQQQNGFAPTGSQKTPATPPQQPPNAYMSPPPQARPQSTQQTGMPGAQGPNPYSPNPTNNPMQPMAQPQMQRQQGTFGAQNPYTQQVADRMTQQVTDNLQRNILPGIRRGQVANGTLGSTRQGIAEGLAIGDTNNALAGAVGNLYSGQFNTDRNYGLQNDAMDLNVYNANQTWMNQGQNNQINLIDRLMNWNQQGINNATQVQNTPMNYWQQFSNSAGGLGGMGGTNSQQMQGNPWLSGLGGAMTGYNLYNQFNKGG